MNTIDDSISIIVPAKNEEENILGVLALLESISNSWKEFKVIFVDDGSEDGTYQLALNYLNTSKLNYKIIKNSTSKNLGGVFMQCLPLVQTNYIMVVQGQGDFTLENFESLFQKFDEKIDLIIPYQLNFKERPLGRQLLSKLFTLILNFKHGLNIKYYNHSVIMKVSDIRSIALNTSSYSYQAEIIIKLLKRGRNYIEVGVKDNFKNKKKTSAFKLSNIIGVIKFLLRG